MGGMGMGGMGMGGMGMGGMGMMNPMMMVCPLWSSCFSFTLPRRLPLDLPTPTSVVSKGSVRKVPR